MTDGRPAPGPAAGARTERSRSIGFGLLVLGALGTVITAGLPWYTADGSSFSGSAITGGVAQALGVALLAGSLLMLALRSAGRRVAAVLVAVIGLVALITMPLQRPNSAEVFAELRKHTLADSYRLQPVGGNLGYAACCLLVLAGAVIVLLRAHRWPQRTDRFDRRPGASAPAAGPDSDPAAIWKSIDAGHDPTVDEGAEPAGEGRVGERTDERS